MLDDALECAEVVAAENRSKIGKSSGGERRRLDEHSEGVARGAPRPRLVTRESMADLEDSDLVKILLDRSPARRDSILYRVLPESQHIVDFPVLRDFILKEWAEWKAAGDLEWEDLRRRHMGTGTHEWVA